MFHPQGPSFIELARQVLTSTQRGYDLLAPKFDYTPFITPIEIIDATIKAAQARQPLGAVLDICCGTGTALVRLLDHQPKRLVGLDFSEGMLAQAKKKLASAEKSVQPELIKGDALQQPFEAAFDLALSFGAFGHIQKQDEISFIQQVYQVLKPAGHFVFTSCQPPETWTASWLLSHGFNGLMRLRNLLPGPSFIMYYLTFMLPEIVAALQTTGFTVEVEPAELPKPFETLSVVIARKPPNRLVQ